MRTRQTAERLRKQRERQQKYRERMKAERRPSRDDVARAFLYAFIARACEHNKREKILKWLANTILHELVTQGFDRKTSSEVIEDLIDKYAKGTWEFRRKIHLQSPVADESSGPSTATVSKPQD